MDDALFVCRRQAETNLHPVVNRLTNRDGTALQQLTQRVALQQLGDEVGCAFEGTQLIHGEDVGMIQRGCGLRLLLKASQPVGIPRNKGWQDLDRNFTFQDRVTGAVDLAHSACAQQAENFIAIKLCARCQRHGEANYTVHDKFSD